MESCQPKLNRNQFNRNTSEHREEEKASYQISVKTVSDKAKEEGIEVPMVEGDHSLI
jgi:hypothetical protein